MRRSIRPAVRLLAAGILATASALTAWPTAHASGEIEVFNSTNTDTERTLADSNDWWAGIQFTANEATTVNRVDVIVRDYNSVEIDYTDYYVQFATGSSTGLFATFTPTNEEEGADCPGPNYQCAKITFTGSASLSDGSDYWLRIGSSARLGMLFYDGEGVTATTEGLALGHTFATSDIYLSYNTSFLDSTDYGYPWVQMFTTSGGDASGSATRTVQISLNAPTDSECRGDAVSGSVGTWIGLPATSKCRPPNASDEVAFLGWATDANFPVVIAQRQVDNGWGAYETKDEAGQLTGVFIPKGGSTFLTNDTNLYPIWSN